MTKSLTNIEQAKQQGNQSAPNFIDAVKAGEIDMDITLAEEQGSQAGPNILTASVDLLEPKNLELAEQQGNQCMPLLNDMLAGGGGFNEKYFAPYTLWGIYPSCFVKNPMYLVSDSHLYVTFAFEDPTVFVSTGTETWYINGPLQIIDDEFIESMTLMMENSGLSGTEQFDRVTSWLEANKGMYFFSVTEEIEESIVGEEVVIGTGETELETIVSKKKIIKVQGNPCIQPPK